MNNQFYYVYLISDFVFMIAEANHFIVYIGEEKSLANYKCQETKLIKKTKEELEEYFLGRRKEFDIPIQLTGTKFQNQVWKEMQKISYGEVISYHELAERCGNKKASRAIGNACHHNKILILIPCHRVVAKNSLGGFRGGLSMKIKLLELEKHRNI